MTREEAVNYMFKEWFYLEEGNKVVLRNNIDKIYDDFEKEIKALKQKHDKELKDVAIESEKELWKQLKFHFEPLED